MCKKLNDNVLIIDIRDEKEHFNSTQKIIRNTINIPLCNLEKQIRKMCIRKDRLIIVFCSTGKRSKVAYITLKDLGFSNIIDAGCASNIDKLLK